MPKYLVIPAADGDSLTNARIYNTPRLTELTNGTSYIAYALSDASPLFTPGAPVVGDFLRAASTPQMHHVHSGHSLTDAYSHGSIDGWPGNLNNIWNGEFDPPYTFEFGLTHIKDTIPGSPLQWRWNQAPESEAIAGIADYDVLMITEGGPPARPTLDDPNAGNETLDYLIRFAQNMWDNGRGRKETILWSIWPNVDGWIGQPDGMGTEYHQFGGFRPVCVEYGRIFRFFAEYATWKMHQENPDLPDDYRIWTFPGHAWMIQLYDDIEDGLVPGITDHRQMFLDDIHPNDVASYGLSLFAHTMLYQIDTRVNNTYAPPTNILSTEMDEYLKGLAWRVATSEESVGMGGTANSAPSWRLSTYGDLLAGTPPVEEPTDPTDPTDPTTGTLPADVIMSWSALGYNGPEYTGPDPVVNGDIVTSSGNVNAPFALPGNNLYVAGHIRVIRDLDNPGNYSLFGAATGPSSYDSRLVVDFNGYINSAGITYRPTSDWQNDVGQYSGQGVFADFATVEAWMIGDELAVSINGGTPVTADIPPEMVGTRTFTHINMLGKGTELASTDMEFIGFTALPRMPTEQERVAIRNWVESPSGVSTEEPTEPVDPVDPGTLPAAGLLYREAAPRVMDGVTINTVPLATPSTPGNSIYAAIRFLPDVERPIPTGVLFELRTATAEHPIALIHRSTNELVAMANSVDSVSITHPVTAADIAARIPLTLEMWIDEAQTPNARLRGPGTQIGNSTSTFPTPTEAITEIRFGTPLWGGEIFTGVIQDFVVYDRMPTQAERDAILASFNA